jgi:hypothetical protein
MTTVPIHIILHGLIALVPTNGTGGANHMTALLVDARNPPPGMTCVVAHTPEIRFPTTSAECTAVDECRLEGSECACILARQEISILPDADLPRVVLAKKPIRSLPFDKDSAGDFAYVGNLVQLGYTLNPAFLATGSLQAPLPAQMVARFQFPFGAVRSCNLSTRRDDGADYVHPLNFRIVGAEEQTNEVSQALAQIFLASAAIPVNESAGEILKLRISPFPGEGGQVHEFSLLNSPAGVMIMLTNSRPAITTPDDPCDDGVARDFAFFYELVQNPPTWFKRPVPHVKYSLSKSIADLDSEECTKHQVAMSRPICPMGSFNPE